MSQHYLNSAFREKLIEHLLIGELLKESWQSDDCSLEISKPEVDNSGYDIIAEASGVIRHIQLKASYLGATTARQKVHVDLADKPSGCVLWVYFDQDTLDLGPFLLFSNPADQPLPSIKDMRVAKHTRANADGVKSERPAIRVIPKGEFDEVQTIAGLYDVLFFM